MTNHVGSIDQSNYVDSDDIELVQNLFRGEAEYSNVEMGDEEDGDSSVLPISDGPRLVVDPRSVGYKYPSYLFVETGKDLPSVNPGGENDIGAFFEDDGRYNALLTGICLGDFDAIHRRVESGRPSHVRFVVESVERQDVDFLKSVETYPIVSIARWHGQDVNLNNMTETVGADELDPFEKEVLFEYMQDPDAAPTRIWERIEDKPGDSEPSDLGVTEQMLRKKNSDSVKETKRGLEEEGVILGTSVDVHTPSLGEYHALVGLKVESRGESDEENLPNERIMEEIKGLYADGWRMPYIVSGMGQRWAEVIVEVHLDEVREMNDVAETLRDEVDGVQSTQTYLLTHESKNETLRFHNSQYLR